jgi:menaquinone-dependent protoporphyrinogen IX oxidase
MTKPIVVGYATKRGSTREVAGTVAPTLRARGLTVDAPSSTKLPPAMPADASSSSSTVT